MAEGKAGGPAARLGIAAAAAAPNSSRHVAHLGENGRKSKSPLHSCSGCEVRWRSTSRPQVRTLPSLISRLAVDRANFLATDFSGYGP